jgi:hypothetical protein
MVAMGQKCSSNGGDMSEYKTLLKNYIDRSDLELDYKLYPDIRE